jgi:hypothetical protein
VEAEALRKQGWTISAIARHLGVTRVTVRQYKRCLPGVLLGVLTQPDRRRRKAHICQHHRPEEATIDIIDPKKPDCPLPLLKPPELVSPEFP